ncbi:hypothetical protein [Anaerosporobacter faecicola]|uniref:hypothetical protein n=1 Tax=Anaerosporobacter faecicola TaxID=2718714 RepID=UPI00143A9C61|nr:hypothetical protein [Anaerosporobacter faecicola]
MTQKKSRFWTFCFSFIPGAAEMYMGFMKMGLSLMLIFFGLFAVGVTIELGPLMFLLVVAWFYSFFHAHNLAGMSDEEFYAVEDTYLFPTGENESHGEYLRTYRKPVAFVLIAVGCMMLWRSCMSLFIGFLPDELYYSVQRFSYRLPQLFVGILIIYLGVIMIRGKKVQIDQAYKNTEEQSGLQNQQNYQSMQTPQYMQNQQSVETPQDMQKDQSMENPQDLQNVQRILINPIEEEKEGE